MLPSDPDNGQMDVDVGTGLGRGAARSGAPLQPEDRSAPSRLAGLGFLHRQSTSTAAKLAFTKLMHPDDAQRG
jgi:hypothetical protein